MRIKNPRVWKNYRRKLKKNDITKKKDNWTGTKYPLTAVNDGDPKKDKCRYDGKPS